MSSSQTADRLESLQRSTQLEDQHSLLEPEPQNTEKEQQIMSAASNTGRPCMQLKGSLVPMTVLELNYFDADQFEADLIAKTSQAPDFFDNLPVVIGLEKFDENGSLPFNKLIEICREQSIRIVAVRGGNELLQSAAKQAGLGLLAKQKERTSPEPAPSEAALATAQPEIQEPQNTHSTETPTVEQKVETVEVEVVKTVVQKERQVSKIVHHPIRSGQQVYAADGDLVVLASVSAGAEILADGNIHVYGALRGRALAGVKGDTKARVFCHSMAAELISIAGQYKISEDIDKNVLGKPAQAYLDKDALCFKNLEL